MNNKFEIENVHSVEHAEDGQDFICKIKFAGFEQELPFRASIRDSEEHGRLIHARILAKEFGEPAAHVPYVEPEAERLDREAKEAAKQAGRDKLLALGLTLEEITAMGLRS